jgi:hypothetical protein
MTGTIQHLSFDAPIKTISEANCRDHWAVKSRRRKSQQAEVDAMLLNALRGRKIALPCVVKLTRVAPKVLDTDNLASAFKATRDGIARRLGIDDGDPRIKFEYDQIAVGRHEYNIVVEIRSS